MLKHKNYLTVSFFFILIFFLFQVVVYDSTVPAASASNKEVSFALNERIDTTQPVASEAIAPSNIVLTGAGAQDKEIGKSFAVAYGYLKQPAIIIESLAQLSQAKLNEYYSVCITTRNIDAIGSIDMLIEYMAQGGNVIFTQLPEKTRANYSKLERIMGIYETGDEYTHTDFEVWEGLLVGGPYATEDEFEFNTSPVKLYGSCKTYAVCTDEDIVRNEDKNPLMWRTYHEKGAIFVVNGPMMREKSGIGILAAFLCDLHDDFLYPIVNAKATMLNNFPYITSKNDEALKEKYNREMLEFTRDIMWSDLVSIMRDSNLVYTAFVSQADFNNTRKYNQSLIEFLSRELTRNKGEIAYTLPKGEGNLTANLKRDSSFFKEVFPKYQLKGLSLPAGKTTDFANEIREYFPGVSTISGGLDQVDLAYIDKNTLTVPYSSRGFYSTDEQRWSLANYVTAIGIVTHEMDMDLPIMDETPEHTWREASIEVSKYLNWQKWKYGWVPSYKMSEFSVKAKNFLYMNVDIKYSENEINAEIKNFTGEGFFILRTERTIKRIYGCDISKARHDEDGLILIKATEKNVRIITADEVYD